MMMERKDFLRNMALGAAVSMIPGSLLKANSKTAGLHKPKERFEKISFGIISDLHQDFTFDAPKRLEAYVADMNRKKPDFILQLGDFCCPVDGNKVIMDIWNGFKGEKRHVLGNHEFDQNCTVEDCVKFFGMPKDYYSFDMTGYHFVVMNTNGVIPSDPKRMYPSYIHDEQFRWLEADLRATKLPTIVFCHHPLDVFGVENGEAVRLLLENANKEAGFLKVKVVFSGHLHQDFCNQINGIHYVQVNSATYRWLGKPYNNESLPKQHYKRYPLIRYMAYYEEPLWAYVTIETSGKLRIQGRNSSWRGDSPYDMGMEKLSWEYPSVTKISDLEIQL